MTVNPQRLFQNVLSAASLVCAGPPLNPEVRDTIKAINPATYRSTASGLRALVEVTKNMPGDYVFLHVAAKQAADAYEKAAEAEPPEDFTVKQKRIIEAANKAGADVRSFIECIPLAFSDSDSVVFAGKLRKLATLAGTAGVSLHALKVVLEDAATYLERE